MDRFRNLIRQRFQSYKKGFAMDDGTEVLDAGVEAVNTSIDPVLVEIPPHAWLHGLAAVSSSRYALGGVQFDFANGRVIGTDGRILGIASVPGLRDIGFVEPVLLDARDMGRAIKAMGRPRLELRLSYDANRPAKDAWSFVVCNSAGKDQTIVPAGIVEGRFPNVDPVLYKAQDDDLQMAVSPVLLDRVDEVVRRIPFDREQYSDVDVHLDLRLRADKPETNPFQIRTVGYDSLGRAANVEFVLMPIAKTRLNAESKGAAISQRTVESIALVQWDDRAPVAVKFANEAEAVAWAIGRVKYLAAELYFAARGEVDDSGDLSGVEADVIQARVLRAIQTRLSPSQVVRVCPLTTTLDATKSLSRRVSELGAVDQG